MADLKFFLDGIETNPPVGWEDIKIVATWLTEADPIGRAVQPTIATDEFVWVNEAAHLIQNYVEAGKTNGPGVLRGIPLKITATDPVTGSAEVFDGYLDFAGAYRAKKDSRDTVPQISTKITKPEDVDSFNNRMMALSYGYLNEKGLIKSSDFQTMLYVVKPLDRGQDILWMAVSAFLIGRELYKAIEEIAGIFADLVVPFTTVQSVVKIILKLIYIVIMIILLLKYLLALGQHIISIPRIQFAMSLKQALTIPCRYLGLEIETNLEDLDHFLYVPSKKPFYHKTAAGRFLNVAGGIDRSGVPSTGDYGYSCAEMLRLAVDLCNAELKVDNGKLYIYNEGDPFWVKNSTFVLPDVLLENYEYNVSDMVATKMFGFAHDPQDDWTVEDFTGTNYQVDLHSTQAIPTRLNLLKGYKEYRFPVALGSRKTVNDKVEALFQKLFSVLAQFKPLLKKLKSKNPVVNFFLSLQTTTGIMQVQNRNWSVPKVVYFNNGIPANHRDKLSARALYNKYYKYRSFAAPHTGQRIRYRNVEIPFGLADYLKLQKNSYFKTASGRIGKFLALEWKLAEDVAVADIEFIEPYVKTLTETTFEP